MAIAERNTGLIQALGKPLTQRLKVAVDLYVAMVRIIVNNQRIILVGA